MEKAYQRNMDIMAADMNGETVMMNIATGQYYNIGEVGGRIWELLEQPMTLGALVDALTAEYAVEKSQCEMDLMPFLDKMAKNGLVMNY